MARNLFTQNPVDAANEEVMSRVRGAVAPGLPGKTEVEQTAAPAPATPREFFDGLAGETKLPPNLIWSLAESAAKDGTFDPEAVKGQTAKLQELMAQGRDTSQALAMLTGDPKAAEALMNRAYDIADSEYPTAEKQAEDAARNDNYFATDAVNMGVGGAIEGTGMAISGVGRITTGGSDPLYDDPQNAIQKLTNIVDLPVRGIGWLFEKAGGALMDDGKNVRENVSDTTKDALAGSEITGDMFKPSTWSMGENPSLRGLTALSVGVLGNLVPVIAANVLTGGGATGMVAAGVTGAGQGGEGAAQNAREELQKLAESGELQANSEIYQRMIEAGIPEDQAVKRLIKAGEKVASLFAAPIAGAGGAFTAGIVGKGVGALAGRGIGTRVAGTAAISAVEEGTQEVAESVAGVTGLNLATGMGLDPFENTFGDFIMGAMAGGPLGALGGIRGEGEADAPPDVVPAPAPGPEAAPAPPEVPIGSGPIPEPEPAPVAPAAPPAGPMETAQSFAPPPVAEPVEAIQRFPDLKPGAAVNLRDGDGRDVPVTFLREDEGGIVVRDRGQELLLTDEEFDSARIAGMEEAAKPKASQSETRPAPAPVPQRDPIKLPKTSTETRSMIDAGIMAGIPDADLVELETHLSTQLADEREAAPEPEAPKAAEIANTWSEPMTKNNGDPFLSEDAARLAVKRRGLNPEEYTYDPKGDGVVATPRMEAAPDEPVADNRKPDVPAQSPVLAGPAPAAASQDTSEPVAAPATAPSPAAQAPDLPQPARSEVKADESAPSAPVSDANASPAPMGPKSKLVAEFNAALKADSVAPSQQTTARVAEVKAALVKMVGPEAADLIEQREKPAAAPATEAQRVERRRQTAPFVVPEKDLTKSEAATHGGQSYADGYQRLVPPKMRSEFGEVPSKAWYNGWDKANLAAHMPDADAATAAAPAKPERVTTPKPEVAQGGASEATKLEIKDYRTKAAILTGRGKDNPPVVKNYIFTWQEKEQGWSFSRKRVDEVKEALGMNAAQKIDPAYEGMSVKDAAKAALTAAPNPYPELNEAGDGVADPKPAAAAPTKAGPVKADDPMGDHTGDATGYADGGTREDGSDAPGKKAFKNDAMRWGKRVVALAKAEGFTPQTNAKFKEEAPVTYNAGGMAGSGDVYVNMIAPNGMRVSLNVNAGSSMASRDNGVFIIHQTRESNKFMGPNDYPAGNITPSAMVERMLKESGRRTPKAETAPANAADQPRAKAISDINRIVTPANAEGDGWYTSGQQDVAMDEGADGDISFTITKSQTRFKGRVKVTNSNVKEWKLSDLGPDLSDVVKGEVKAFRDYIALIDEDNTADPNPTDRDITVAGRHWDGLINGQQRALIEKTVGKPAMAGIKWDKIGDDAQARLANAMPDSTFATRRPSPPQVAPLDGMSPLGKKPEAASDSNMTEGEAVNFILKAVSEAKIDNDYVGLRVTEDPLEVGNDVPDSRVWDDGEPTNEKLDGASAIEIDDNANSVLAVLKQAGIIKNPRGGGYFGKHVAIIASNQATYGVDQNEIILKTADVIATFVRADDMGPLIESNTHLRGETPPAARKVDAPDQEAIKNEKPNVAKPKADYGATNTLVSQDRRAELAARLKDKLKNQINSGIDPEILAIGAELTVFHIEAGARKFAAAIAAVADDLGMAPRDLTRYARSWYNGARDMMEDSDLPIDGMDDADTVREALAAMKSEPTTSELNEADPSDKVEGAKPAPQEGKTNADNRNEGNRQPEPEIGEQADPVGTGRSGETGPVSGRPSGTGNRTSKRAGKRPEPGADGAGVSDSGSDQQRGRDTGAANHVIEVGGLDPIKGEKTRARASIAAIRTMKAAAAANRPLTAEERGVVSQYGGAGTLATSLPRSDGTIKHADLNAALTELLTEEELRTLSRTSQYAFYTAETALRGMWTLAEQLGFKGGRVYEPGMGVGGFMGTMPQSVRADSRYTGLELDHVTAQIAKALYPRETIKQGDFIKEKMPKDYYDLAIGNPPFAGTRIQSDPDYPQNFVLHDYFFAKTLDSVRPGGLLMFVTSAGTMNKMDSAGRDYLADQADLVGAIRLPNTAFKENGTEVTTDIIVLRKRLPGEVEADPDWRKARVETFPDADGVTADVAVNGYFMDNPGMVLGEMGLYDTLTAGARIGVRPKPGSNFKADLKAALESFPKDVMSKVEASQQLGLDAVDAQAEETRTGGFYIKDGVLFQFDGRVGKPIMPKGKDHPDGLSATHIAKIEALIPIKMGLSAVYAADLDGRDATAERKALNKAYDAFVKDHGPINKQNRREQNPSAVQFEKARMQAYLDATASGLPFDMGSLDIAKLIEEGLMATAISNLRKAAATEPGYNSGEF